MLELLVGAWVLWYSLALVFLGFRTEKLRISSLFALLVVQLIFGMLALVIIYNNW